MNIDFVLGTNKKIVVELESCTMVICDDNHDTEDKLVPFNFNNKKEIVDKVYNGLDSNYHVVDVDTSYNINMELVKLVIVLIDKKDSIHRLSVRCIIMSDLLD